MTATDAAPQAPQQRRKPAPPSALRAALIVIPWLTVAALVVAIGVGGLHSEKVKKVASPREAAFQRCGLDRGLAAP